ncbi:hypothetical protein Aperf_G00000027344 [Anoplocephala perfoliata]
MNGTSDSCTASPVQQLGEAVVTSVASAPDLSSIVSGSNTPAPSHPQSQTPTSQPASVVPISRPSVIVTIPTQLPVVSNPTGSPIVFAAPPAPPNGSVVVPSSALAAPNGSVVVPSSALAANTSLPISVSAQPLTFANGTVVTVVENSPKSTASILTTPSTILPASSTPVIQSVASAVQPTGRDCSQQKQIPVFKSRSLQEIVKETDPYLQLDDDAEDVIALMAEEFLEDVAKKSIKLANHRGSSTVEARDVKHTLERHWDVTIPGFPTSEKNIKRPFITQAHKQHLAFLQRQVKRS